MALEWRRGRVTEALVRSPIPFDISCMSTFIPSSPPFSFDTPPLVAVHHLIVTLHNSSRSRHCSHPISQQHLHLHLRSSFLFAYSTIHSLPYQAAGTERRETNKA
jgi:hypothetical protein